MNYSSFKPGQIWNDTDGEPIQAHGGGVLFHKGVYYWYGENKNVLTEPAKLVGYRTPVIGISCYSSSDLYNWRHEGIVLSAQQSNPDHDLHTSKVVERPKVIFNERTQQFVMWMHIDSEDYDYAAVGVAVSDSPVGPFRYLYSMHPNGLHSRDFTLFQDIDGKAYLLHSSNWNKTLMIAELTTDYLSVTGVYSEQFVNMSREAPAIARLGSQYYLITSGCTGWDPNEAELAVSSSLHGPWTTVGNPCTGAGAESTFQAQSSFILPVAGDSGRLIFLADRWYKEDLQDSRYVWLPIEVQEGSLSISWHDEWSL